MRMPVFGEYQLRNSLARERSVTGRKPATKVEHDATHD